MRAHPFLKTPNVQFKLFLLVNLPKSRLFADPNQSISEICSTLEISRSTLYRYVQDAKRASSPSDPPTYLYRNFPQNFGIFKPCAQSKDT
ncbi:MAG TPA: helix-turn-helix domain-containing protein [Ktedonobacteraceae bacterium]